MVIDQPSILSENLISTKNECDKPIEDSFNVKTNIFEEIQKSTKSKRGRRPKNFSSSVSTCSENSNKNPYSFKSSSSDEENKLKIEKFKRKSLSNHLEKARLSTTITDFKEEELVSSNKVTTSENEITTDRKKEIKARRKSAPVTVHIPIVNTEKQSVPYLPLTPPKSSSSISSTSSNSSIYSSKIKKQKSNETNNDNSQNIQEAIRPRRQSRLSIANISLPKVESSSDELPNSAPSFRGKRNSRSFSLSAKLSNNSKNLKLIETPRTNETVLTKNNPKRKSIDSGSLPSLKKPITNVEELSDVPITNFQEPEVPRVNLKRKRTATIKPTNLKTTENKKESLKKLEPVKKNIKSTLKKKVEIEENEEEDEENDENKTSSSSDESDSDLDIEYAKLQPGTITIKKENVCGVCELNLDLIDCQGTCQQSFHLECIGLLCEPLEGFKCDECKSGMHTCFECKKPSTPECMTKKCVSPTCGRYFHEECAKSNQQFRIDSSNPNKITFLCPSHTCSTCWIEKRHKDSNEIQENNSAMSQQPYKGRFMKCVRCSNAYHVGDYCLAAGSLILAGYNIVCPSHFQPVRKLPQHNRVNVTWCFVCCKNEKLIGCRFCPAAYHYECIDKPPSLESILNISDLEPKLNTSKSLSQNSSKNSSPSSIRSSTSCLTMNTVNSVNSTNNLTAIISTNWTCEDCLIGRKPLYGQIVWSKVGGYRWWPAQICHPRNLPDKLKDQPYQVGEFPVKFFGTNDYYWVTIGRTFVFAEGDELGAGQRTGTKLLAQAYSKGVEAAIVAFKEVQRLKASRLPKNANSKENLSMALSNFQYIKTNRPVGNVKIYRVPISDLPCCDCDPKSAKPCGTNECMNRVLKYECHPAVCPAGDRCQNQRFTKRQYPKQEPMPCGGRGWGLRTASNTTIKKGDFINEYVGELIDDEECKKRLKYATENHITSFYFLTIDKDRVIDAGPKGNLSRFMNHSCEPNVETQKWNVNGDIRIGLFALTDIPGDTELTFNYNLDCLSNEKAQCKCGSKNCSGFIGDRPKNINNTINANNNGPSNTNNSSNESKSINKKNSRLSIGNALTKAVLAKPKLTSQKKKNSRKSIA